MSPAWLALAGALVALAASTPDPATPPARCATVVSLAPTLAELVAELGRAERLLAVTRYDDDPRLAHLPRVGGLLDPDLERIAALRPSCVLHIGGGGSLARTLRPLARLGCRPIELRAESLHDLPSSAVRLGALLDAPAAAAAWAVAWQAALFTLSLGPRLGPDGAPAPSALVVHGVQPLVVGGPGSLGAQLLALAGLANAAAGGGRYPIWDAERLAASRPALLFDASSPGGAGALLERLAPSGTRVVPLRDPALLRPGPRTLQAWRRLLAGLALEAGPAR